MKETNIRIPAYSIDKRQLVQITEIILNGKKVVQRIPLKAYQTIHKPSDSAQA